MPILAKAAPIKTARKAGGNGVVTVEPILGATEMAGKCGLFAKVTLPPGASLGYHEHHGESETYYILSGSGEFNDNGSIRAVSAGDALFTPSGCGHALGNNADGELVFIALIIKDNACPVVQNN